MQSALRPYATAGVTVVGTGLLAVTPLAAPPPDLPDVQSRVIQLTSGDDAWSDVFSEAHTNIQQLNQNFGLAPFVGLQQHIVNQADFVKSVMSDPANITSATNEMQEHVKAAMSSFTLLHADDDTVTSTIAHTLNTQLDLGGLGSGFITAGHNLVFDNIGTFLPAGTDLSTVTPILNFLASPASALLMGLVGPILSPWVALANSIGDGNGLSADLAHFVGGFLNGADLNLDSIIPAVAGILPAGTSINSIDLALGGLLSTGGGNFGAGTSGMAAPNDVFNDTYVLFNSDGDVSHSVEPVGGSLLNELGLNITVPSVTVSGFTLSGPLTIDIPSGGVGPIAALEEHAQIVGVLLGSGWDGKQAAGEIAPEATAPLIGFPDIS